MMKKKTGYSSLNEIKIAREKLRYESKLQEEKLKSVNYLMFSGISMSMRNLSFNIRNRLLSFALFRSLYKSKFTYDFIRNFIRGFSRTR